MKPTDSLDSKFSKIYEENKPLQETPRSLAQTKSTADPVPGSGAAYAGDGSCAEGDVVVPEADAMVVLILAILLPGFGAFMAAYRSIDGFNCNCCG